MKRGVDELVILGERAAETEAGQVLVNILISPEPSDNKNSDDTDGRNR
jgi:hypothetical protein